MKKILLSLVAVLLLGLTVPLARANGINIVNGDFSAPVTMTNSTPYYGSWETGVVPGWTVTDPIGGAGIFAPSASIFPSIPGGGSQIAWADTDASLSQDVGPLSANTSYMYSVYVGQRLDNLVANYTITLLDGSTVLASLTGSNGAVTPGGWQLETLSFSTGSNVSGDLDITLSSSGQQSDFADDSVEISSTPEPATLVMFGSGLLGLAGVFRRKLKTL